MERTLFDIVKDAGLIYDELEPEIFPMYEEIFDGDVPPISFITENILAHIEDMVEENPNLYRHIMLNPKTREALLEEIRSVIIIARMDLEEEEY